MRIVNTERIYSATWAELEQPTRDEQQSLMELAQLSATEAELARVIAILADRGCALGSVRFTRTRGGELTGDKRDAVPTPHLGCSKVAVRLGKKCATPGCEFTDFHDGPCSHEMAPPKRRRCSS